MHGRFNSDSSQIPVSQSSLQFAAQGVRGFELICDVHKSTNCFPHFELDLLRGCDFVQMNHSGGEIFIDTEVNCLLFCLDWISKMDHGSCTHQSCWRCKVSSHPKESTSFTSSLELFLTQNQGITSKFGELNVVANVNHVPVIRA